MSEGSAPSRPKSTAQRGEPYFLWAGIVTAAVVVAGFGLNFLFEGLRLPPFTPVVGVHGLLMLGWYVLFVVQVRLVGGGSLKLHMRLGRSSAWLAAAMLVSGVMVMATAYRRNMAEGLSEQAVLVGTFNLANLVAFALLYALGYVRRTRFAGHKRFMFLAGVAMLPPALGRLVAALGLSDAVAVAILLALPASLLVYDRRSTGRVQAASWQGGAIVLLSLFGSFALIASGVSARLLSALLGP